MSETQAVLLSHTGKLTREQLALVSTPAGTATHRASPAMPKWCARSSIRSRCGTSLPCAKNTLSRKTA